MIADSATGPKTGSLPALGVIIAWVGYYHRAPIFLIHQDHEEFLDPNSCPRSTELEISAGILLNHLNSLRHVHPGGRQAAIFVGGLTHGDPAVLMLEASGGSGSWNRSRSELPNNFMAGCLEPFGIRGLCAQLDDCIGSKQELASLALAKSEYANDWLRRNGRDVIIAPPCAGYHLSACGVTALSSQRQQPPLLPS